MGFMTGKTGSFEQIPGDVVQLRQMLAGRLGTNMDQLFGPNDMEQILAPYRAMFDERNKMVGAQAAESAGNLTGSGFANTLGTALGRQSTEQGGFLAGLLNQNRENQANRLANLLAMMSGTGVGPPQQTYTPGFLDYLMQGVQTVASAIPLMGGGGTPAYSSYTGAPWARDMTQAPVTEGGKIFRTTPRIGG